MTFPNPYCLLIVLLASCTGRQPAGDAARETADPNAGYRLVWADEFDAGTRPDTANWGYEEGFVRNNEDQWYQPDNARIENGHLVITGRRESRPNPNFRGDSGDWRQRRPAIAYTSSSIHTRGRRAWKYGRFELRANIPVGEGYWPAWWTLGTQGRWPSNGEIDIMEYYDGDLLANVASRAADGGARWSSVRVPVDSLGGAAWAADFHVWRMDWDEDKIELYVDDRLLNRTRIADMPNAGDYPFEPFHQPHYMLINLALGGNKGGNIEDAPLPVAYRVDYVRVYQREGE